MEKDACQPIYLTEDKKSQLISKSKHAANYSADNQHKGKNRFQRRLYSKVSQAVREFNKINMEKLFTKDILDINILVHGETGDYSVKISFSGIIELIREQLERNNKTPEDEIGIRDISRALSKAFDTTDVYIHCSCPDFKYRFGWWALANGVSSFAEVPTKDNKDAENRIVVNRAPEITNPTDDKGAGCKHCMLVLSNNSWLLKVASVIRNYIQYMKVHYESTYAEKIYPALYGEETEYQMNFLDPKELDTPYRQGDEPSDDMIDAANKWAKTKGQWKKGNEYRFKPKEKSDTIVDGDQKQLDLDSLISDEE